MHATLRARSACAPPVRCSVGLVSVASFHCICVFAALCGWTDPRACQVCDPPLAARAILFRAARSVFDAQSVEYPACAWRWRGLHIILAVPRLGVPRVVSHLVVVRLVGHENNNKCPFVIIFCRWPRFMPHISAAAPDLPLLPPWPGWL